MKPQQQQPDREGVADWNAIGETAQRLAEHLELPAVAALADALSRRGRGLRLKSQRSDVPDYALQVSALVGARWHEADPERDSSGPLDIDFLNGPHENRISRLHARLWYQDGLWRVEDCSRCGTLVDGEQLGSGRQRLLRDGERLCFDHLCFEVILTDTGQE